MTAPENMMTEKKKCSECVFHIQVDSGYSNWTVEGSTIYCAKKLHPEGGFDRWYGTDSRDLFAGKCQQFIHGDGVVVDVDREAMIWTAETPEERWSNYITEYINAREVDEVV